MRHRPLSAAARPAGGIVGESIGELHGLLVEVLHENGQTQVRPVLRRGVLA